jgi:hypothetical protein
MGNSDGRQAGREAHHVDVASGRRSADTAGLRDLLRASFVHRSRPTARPPRDRLSASGHIYHPRLARIRDVLLSGLHDPCYGRGGGNVVCCLVGEPAALVRGSQHVARQKRPDPDRESGLGLLALRPCLEANIRDPQYVPQAAYWTWLASMFLLAIAGGVFPFQQQKPRLHWSGQHKMHPIPGPR